jgi:outer membrane protein assembly factor BamB
MKYENMHALRQWMGKWKYLWATAAIGTVISIVLIPSVLTIHAASGDWPTYMADNGRSGFNPNETIINPSTAPNLKLKWIHTAGGAVSTQAVEANGLVYWGSWDGYEHATKLDNTRLWATNIGTTTDSACSPPRVGVASTGTIGTVTISGTATSVDFVGGGNGKFYAINALTGAIIWQKTLGSSPSHFIWSSPALFNNSIYIGMSSFGDCPLVQGQLIQLDATTGSIQHTFNVVPSGCTGGSVWSSPTIDEAAGTVYISTGNQGPCSSSESNTIALVELSASDLSFIHHWQVPASQQISDGDFGSTPTLFTASGTPMVGLENKNGIFYAFTRANIASGAVWNTKVATSRGSQSSAAWDGNTLYVGSSGVTLGGTSCAGSVAALNPDTGAIKWQHCMKSGEVTGAVIAVPGLVILGQGTYLMILAATSGSTLFRYNDTNSGSRFWGWASVSNGVLYIGNNDGRLYAFAP